MGRAWSRVARPEVHASPSAVSAPGGTYEATYKVYFGDASGTPLDGYGAGEATLTWNAVPAPGAAMTLALGGLCACRRRRS